MKVDEWSVSPELAAHVQKTYPKVNHPRAWDRFMNHHRAKATRSTNFNALFLNWGSEDADKIGEQHDGGTDYKGIPNDSAGDWNDWLMGRGSGGSR